MAGDLDRARTRSFSSWKKAHLRPGLLPEQTIDAPSDTTVQVGLGVAQPLVWAHAEDILLHRSIEEGKVFDAPRAQ